MPPHTVRRATSAADLAAAYHLVHDEYVRAGYILASPTGIRERSAETAGNMVTFIAEADDRLVGIVSVVQDSVAYGLPSDHAFGDELATLRTQGTVAEVTNLVIVPGSDRRILFGLTSECLAQVIEWGCAKVFVAISPKHARFWQRAFAFEPVGAPRSYSETTPDIVQGMAFTVPREG